ncbi:hypothetical protein ACXZ65_30970 [Streptomyces aculeolatus]
MVNREGFDYWLMDKGVSAEQARWFLDRYAHRLAQRQRAHARLIVDGMAEIDRPFAEHLGIGMNTLIRVIDPGAPFLGLPPAA